MRIRATAMAVGAVLVLATAVPTSARQEIREFRGRIALPAPMVSAELGSGSGYNTGEMLRRTCPSAGEGDGVVYKFFDLQGRFTHFFLEGPPLLVDGSESADLQDYDLDLYVFDAKCNPVELEGDIMASKGVGRGVAKAPASYAVVAYFSGPPDLPVRLRASSAPIAG